jgi:hypothetical protein
MDTSSKRRHRGLLVVKIAVGVALAAGMGLAASPAMAAAPAVAAPATSTTVTPFTNSVHCDIHPDFLQLWKLSGEELCFANAGDLDVAVYDVDHLESGNNAGWVRYIAYNGRTYQQSFGKFNSIHIGGEVTHIHII